MKNTIQIKNENIEKLNNEININKTKENKLKEELTNLNKEKILFDKEDKKLKEEISKLSNEIIINKQNILKIQKENEILNENNNNILNEKKNLEDTINKQKKLLEYQDKEIISLKNNKKEDINITNSNNNIYNDNNYEENSFNNLNKEEKKNKKRNIFKPSDQFQIEKDKIVLKYELLKNDYDKLNTTLQQKQKLLDNYSKLTNETSSKTNKDEQILELIAEHKKEIDNLTKIYNQNIISLKMNLPISYSPNTHYILIDKKYVQYNLKWFLLTIITEQEKNYENTFWVPEDEIKPMLDQFNKFRTENEIKDEQFEGLLSTQQNLINKIDNNEKLIAKLKEKLEKYENNNTS